MYGEKDTLYIDEYPFLLPELYIVSKWQIEIDDPKPLTVGYLIRPAGTEGDDHLLTAVRNSAMSYSVLIRFRKHVEVPAAEYLNATRALAVQPLTDLELGAPDTLAIDISIDGQVLHSIPLTIVPEG